jgi:hypothetical protein
MDMKDTPITTRPTYPARPRLSEFNILIAGR